MSVAEAGRTVVSDGGHPVVVDGDWVSETFWEPLHTFQRCKDRQRAAEGVPGEEERRVLLYERFLDGRQQLHGEREGV